MDAYQKMVQDGGILGKIAKIIPGVGGYLEREQRRTSDKMQRDYLAQQLTTHKGKVSDIVLEITNAMKLDLLNPMDEITKKLDKMISKITYADYGYAGFFDAVKIDGPELAKMYEFDLSLIEYVQSIGGSLTAIENGMENSEDDGELKKKAKAVIKTLNDLDNIFNDREHIISGVKG
jgi:hypothetical protein